MPTYIVSGPSGTETVKASDEAEARHKYMVLRWGDVSDKIVPRSVTKDGVLEPYHGLGLSVRELV